MPLAAAPPVLVPEVDFIHDPLTLPFRRFMATLGLYSWYRLQEVSPATALADASGNGRVGTASSGGSRTT